MDQSSSFASGGKYGSAKVSEGSEKTSSSSLATFKPIVDQKGELVEADCRGDLANVACNFNVIESLVDCPIDLTSQELVRGKSPSCLIFSSNVVDSQFLPYSMVCRDEIIPVEDMVVGLSRY